MVGIRAVGEGERVRGLQILQRDEAPRPSLGGRLLPDARRVEAVVAEVTQWQHVSALLIAEAATPHQLHRGRELALEHARALRELPKGLVHCIESFGQRPALQCLQISLCEQAWECRFWIADAPNVRPPSRLVAQGPLVSQGHRQCCICGVQASLLEGGESACQPHGRPGRRSQATDQWQLEDDLAFGHGVDGDDGTTAALAVVHRDGDGGRHRRTPVAQPVAQNLEGLGCVVGVRHRRAPHPIGPSAGARGRRPQALPAAVLRGNQGRGCSGPGRACQKGPRGLCHRDPVRCCGASRCLQTPQA
mmetsp:Transcript_3587/g.10908  ORF Transcript_3587/g.10908 Transcript_3587/m.10908 type:complete len:305 (-) Transcript_3587:135-1049(-)